MDENASGEASSGNGASDNNSTACPTCGRDGFKNTAGMKRHHAQVHGESIAGELVDCDWCGEEFRQKPNNTDGSNYCSNDCYSNGRSEKYSGEGHPRWAGGGVQLKCEYCDSEYTAVRAESDGSRFCSNECKSDWLSENRTGEDHHLYSRIECECEICGEEVLRKPSQYEAMDNVFCSQECHREYQSIHQVGENHHNYNGGRVEEYGPRWEKIAEERRKVDDYECQICGLSQEEHSEALSVHHIRPRESFIDDGEFDHEAANRMGNLITLCKPCHRKWEGIPVIPQ
jgi:endogenous inhibitor of DNA gyrase (YacG/DUF329 family)